MSINKIKKATRKINQLLDNVLEDGEMTRIEKDLFLSYVRDLYDKVLDMNTGAIESKTANRQVDEDQYKSEELQIQAEATTSKSTVDISEVVRREIQQDQPKPASTNDHKHTRNLIEDKPVPQTAPFNVNELSPDQPLYESTEAEVSSDDAADIPDEILSLFESDSINELSDKLSRSPIADLTKCMGINERIFTVNELFGGDTQLFNTSMEQLNNCQSLEQAKDYLVEHVAISNNWQDDANIKKAAKFVKLISRRY